MSTPGQVTAHLRHLLPKAEAIKRWREKSLGGTSRIKLTKSSNLSDDVALTRVRLYRVVVGGGVSGTAL